MLVSDCNDYVPLNVDVKTGHYLAPTLTKSASAIEAVKHSKTPTMIIHGRADGFVPFYMGEELFSAVAAENKLFLPVDGADHGTSYFCDKEKYLNAFNEFIRPLLRSE